MKRILQRNGFELEETAINQIVALLNGAHQLRQSVGSSSSKTITRTTALVVFNELNPSIGKGLSDAGLKWEAFREHVGLSGAIEPIDTSDVDLENDFANAIAQFGQAYPQHTIPSPENLALAIVDHVARNPETGLLANRLVKYGARLDEMGDALRSAFAEFEDARPREQAWILQYDAGDEGAELFQVRGPRGRISWWWNGFPHRDLIKAGDPIVYVERNPDGLPGGDVVGTGRIVSAEPVESTFSGVRLSSPEETAEPVPGSGLVTEIIETFQDEKDRIPRAEAIEFPPFSEEKDWDDVIVELTLDEARHVNAALETRGRQKLNVLPDDSDPGLSQESDTQFVPDDAEVDRDDLGRGVLAIALARRLHRIWCQLNGAMPPGASKRKSLSAAATDEAADASQWTGIDDEAARMCFFDRARDNTRAAFVLHLDAPWGGGKTTFANFVARVLNPTGYSHEAGSFLRQRYGEANLESIFLADPPDDDDAAPDDAESGDTQPDNAKPDDRRQWPIAARRPWIIVPFNAWQSEHVSPPWWVFYQTIRRRCFASVVCEGQRPADIPASDEEKRPGPVERFLIWISLWGHEVAWRLWNPKVRLLGLTALISLIVFVALYVPGIVESKPTPKGDPKVVFNTGGILGVVVSGLMLSGSLIWGIGAVLTESIVPGTNSLAERLSLGQGDPFERFRKHFYRTMERVKRPVLVVVDDIDRCKPDFIVELVRGMQTLLRSPRVVFLIIGDRDWIERAFESHHEAMNKISVGPEQTFGARFVEKAIQMSFILPGMQPDKQTDYVRHLLLGRSVEPVIEPADNITPDASKRLRRTLRKAVETTRDAPLHSKRLREVASREIKTAFESMASSAEPIADKSVEQWVNQELAIIAAADEEADLEVSHRLLPLAPFFPANPRQIKRIVNAVTMYQAVAIREFGLTSDDDLWFQLALWVIVMTEWPNTWRLLASYPAMGDLLVSDDPEKLLKAGPDEDAAAIPESDLPASPEYTLVLLESISSDRNLLALLTGSDGREGPVLDRKTIEKLVILTPLSRQNSPVGEDAADAAADAA